VKEATQKNWGAFIAAAPKELVAPYAIGDVERTAKLFELLREKHLQTPAYQTEMELMPILMEQSRTGLRVDVDKLHDDIDLYTKELERADNTLRRLLKADINLDSPAQLVQALENAGWMQAWEYTEKGQKSVAAAALKAHCTHKQGGALLGYRGLLATLLGTFMGPWAQQAAGTGGRLHANWNQVRSYEGGNQAGTRTGRMSSSHPNLQNVPTEPRVDTPKGYLALPMVRNYLLPERNHVWAGRDFDSQEVRILAHFEDGELLQAYQQNPALDPHAMAQELIKQQTGMDVPRKTVKITAFATIYGAGAGGLSRQLGCSAAEASAVKNAYLRAFPGVRQLQQETILRGKTGEGITTLRGRHYVAEPPVMRNGRIQTFEYKLLNYLIQGSAADQTKKCIVDWCAVKHEDVKFLASVHDEINISIPKGLLKKELEVLRQVMDQPMMDTPMRSTGYIGTTWGNVKK
jgi:DNA polymerase-1